MGLVANRVALGHCPCGRWACTAVTVQLPVGHAVYRYCIEHRRHAFTPAGVALMLSGTNVSELLNALALSPTMPDPSG